MAVAHRASIAASTANPTTTFAITIPASVVVGDVLFVPVTSRDHTAGTALPTCTDNDTGGNTWTLVTNSTDRKVLLFWKRATSGTASKTITVAGCVGSCAGGVACYSGAGLASNPYANVSLETNASADESHAGFTTTYSDSEVCFAVFNYANDNAVTSVIGATVGAFTNRFEQLSTGGNDCATNLSSVNTPQIGATGAITWAQTDGTTYSITWEVVPEAVPTVALNTTDATTFPTATPVLEFTGTDPNAQDVEYQIQITDFDPKVVEQIAFGSTQHSVSGGVAAAGETNQQKGQEFTPLVNCNVESITLSARKTGTPTDNIFVDIVTPGGGGPGGVVLATSNAVAASGLTTTPTDTVFTFSPTLAVTSGSKYFLVIRRSGARDAVNNIQVIASSGDPYASHQMWTRSNTIWTSANFDLKMTVVRSVTTYVDKLSSADAGFLNTVSGGDTTPFNSGQKISYTVQGAGLSNGTYTYRARGKDPSGTNTFGPWSAVRTFSVSVVPKNLTLLGVG